MIFQNRGFSLLALFVTAGLLAGAAKPASPKFIPADALDVIALLPPPPADDSPEAKAELGVVLRTQHDATDAEKSRAKSENKLTMAAFTSVFGPWFTPGNLPKTAALFKQLDADSKQFTNLGKDHFKRPRPYDADSHVVDIVKEHGKEFSYPSGHSTRATLYALVLSDVEPELKGQLLARSQEIGWDRIIAGVHYPSDIIAGRVLGQALAKAALTNPDIKAALEQVRVEIAAARAMTPTTPSALVH